MPKGYWIPHLDVSNPEGFQAYREMADAATSASARSFWRAAAAARWSKARCGRAMCCASSTPTTRRMAYYHGPEYSRAHPLREPHSVCDFLIVEGYDGPQPPPIGTPPAPSRLKGYWIAHIDVTDPEGYKPYQADVATPFGKFGGRYLVRGGRGEVMEGRMPRPHRGGGISELRGGARVLPFARISAVDRAAQRQGDADIVVIEAFDPAQ